MVFMAWGISNNERKMELALHNPEGPTHTLGIKWSTNNPTYNNAFCNFMNIPSNSNYFHPNIYIKF